MTPSRPSNTRRPGFRFSQGQLCITTGQEEMRLGTWPLLEATRRRKDESKWARFVPAFRLLRPKADLLGIEPGPAGVHGQGVDPLFAKHQAFRLFRQSLPLQLAATAERFPARQWAVLRMVQEHAEALDVLAANPALGFCAANLARFRPILGNHGRQAAELVRRPQREVLDFLGFPESQAWVNLFRRIPPECVAVERMQALRETAHPAELAKRLAHLPVLNSGVLELASRPQLLALASPALLLEVATHPEELLQATAVHLLADLVDTLRRMDEPPRFGGIRTLAGLRERAVAIEAAYQRHILLRERTLLTLRFPPPPVPGSDAIVPLTDPGQLIEEGRAQRNCVASYADRVAAGKVFIYRVLAPERATLSLQPSSAREWELGQLLCACNQPVSPATRHSVLRWLAGESVSL